MMTLRKKILRCSRGLMIKRKGGTNEDQELFAA